MPSLQNIAILGSTGSIGTNAIEVVNQLENAKIFALSANSRLSLLCEQAARHQPEILIAASHEHAAPFCFPDLPNSQLWIGEDKLVEIAAHPDVDVVLAAIVGSAGLRSTWAALEAGKTVALANKETLVMAGPLAMDLARERNARVLPVDSEHSAIFQAINGEKSENIKRVILTASGGPFRNSSLSEIRNATVKTALNHPTWKMGPKITIDSATMMNKSLELIEARWLFDLPAEKIDVVIHPQSIVHSLVEFVDGSIMAQMSPPDMKLPIQYALTYPDRSVGPTEKLDFSEAFCLDFQPPDFEKFPALLLGKEVAEKGGTTGAVLNAANEGAVAAFLDDKIGFLDITNACREILNHHDFDPNPSLDDLIALDAWARKEIIQWIAA